MADSGKPVVDEVIHKSDLDSLITTISSSGSRIEDRSLISLSLKKLDGSSSAVHLFYSLGDLADANSTDTDLVEKKAVVDALAKKIDKSSTTQTIIANEFQASATDGAIEITPWSINSTDSDGKTTQIYRTDFGWLGPITKSLQIKDSDNSNSGNEVSLMNSSTTYTLNLPSTIKATFAGNLTGNVTGNCSGSSGSCTGNAATATVASALGDDFGFHKHANTESDNTTATFTVTADKAYLLFQTHSNHYGMYLINTYAKGFTTIIDNNDGLTGISVNKSRNKITVTSNAGRLSLIMVGRNT